MELIEAGVVKKVVVTNSLPLHFGASAKVEQVSVGPMLARVILAEHFRSVNQREETFRLDE